MRPKFTIAIPVHNRAEYLRQAIHSSLGQTVPDFEVVVSDDCSTVDLASVVSAFDDPRIRYHRNGGRLGAAANHQRSVALSRGEFIVNLHSDDLLFPAYLEVAGEALERSKASAAAYSAMATFSGSKVVACQTVPKLRFADKDVYLKHPWLEKFHNTGPTCCLFRRAAFEKIGGYRVSLKFAYDWELFMRFMTIGGGVLFLPEVLSVYRLHDEQACQTVSQQGLFDVLDLWQLNEYSHWPAWEMAALVLMEVKRAMHDGTNWIVILDEIHRRGLTSKVLRGVPLALLNKAYRRGRANAITDIHYEIPGNIESALRVAHVLIGA